MKKVQKALAALLAAVLLCGTLAGCGGASGGEMEYGRYVEEDITPPDLAGDIRNVNVNGSTIDVVSLDWSYDAPSETYEQTMYRYRSEDGGKNWQTLDMDWANDYMATDIEGLTEYKSLNYGMAVLENGDLIGSVSTNNDKGESLDLEFLRVRTDGSMEVFRLPAAEEYLKDGMTLYIQDMQPVGGSRLYMNMWATQAGAMGYSGDGTIHAVFDMDTLEQLYTLEWEGWNILHNDSYFYLQGYDNKFTVIDAATGQQVSLPLPDGDAIAELSNLGMNNNSMFFDLDNNVYSLDSRGVTKLEAEKEPETLMKAENYSFGSPLTSATHFSVLGEEEFFVALSERPEGEGAGQGVLLRYYYDPKAPARSDTVIRVYSMYDSMTVRLAISEFKKQHPEFGVEYEMAFMRDAWGNVTPVGDGVSTEDDALRVLSTELLAGTGPDVLILDDLPMDSYIEQKVLEDISDLAAQSDAMGAIIEPLKQDGKLYAVPAGFAMPLVLGEKGQLGDADTLKGMLAEVEADTTGTSYAEPGEEASDAEWEAYYDARWSTVAPEDRPALGFSNVNEVVDILYKISAPSIYTPGQGLDEQGLKELLENTKAIADKYRLSPQEGYNPAFANSAVADGYITYSIPNLVDVYSSQRANYGIGLFNTFMNLNDIRYSVYWARYNYEYDEDGNYGQVENTNYVMAHPEVALLKGDAGGVYHPSVMAGICTTSDEKEAARDFIACLLSDGVQGRDLANGFPVSEAAFKKLFDNAQEEIDFWWEGEHIAIEPLAMDMDSILAALEVPAYTNTMLLASMMEHAGNYCKGQVGLDAAVQAILSDSELYFAERQ